MSGYLGTIGGVPPVKPPRHRRIVGACFFILGLALFAIPFVLNFQGA